MDSIFIIQQNVLHWSFDRKKELSNYYNKLQPDIILLNSTGIDDKESLSKDLRIQYI